MALTAATHQLEPTPLMHAAVLLTRPGQSPTLQWIVDATRHLELAAFHHDILGGTGTLTEHPPAKGASRGFTQLRVDPSELPPHLVAELPRRLRGAITRQA